MVYVLSQLTKTFDAVRSRLVSLATDARNKTNNDFGREVCDEVIETWATKDEQAKIRQDERQHKDSEHFRALIEQRTLRGLEDSVATDEDIIATLTEAGLQETYTIEDIQSYIRDNYGQDRLREDPLFDPASAVASVRQPSIFNGKVTQDNEWLVAEFDTGDTKHELAEFQLWDAWAILHEKKAYFGIRLEDSLNEQEQQIKEALQKLQDEKFKMGLALEGPRVDDDFVFTGIDRQTPQWQLVSHNALAYFPIVSLWGKHASDGTLVASFAPEAHENNSGQYELLVTDLEPQSGISLNYIPLMSNPIAHQYSDYRALLLASDEQLKTYEKALENKNNLSEPDDLDYST